MMSRDWWFLVIALFVLTTAIGVAMVAAANENPSSQTIEGWAPDISVDVQPTESTESGIVTIDDQTFTSISAAVEHASPGDTITLSGVFEERISIDTPDITLEATDSGAVIDGGGTDTVVSIRASNVTIDGIDVRGSGGDRGNEDTGIHVSAADSTIVNVTITDITYGIWIREAENVTVTDTVIVGRETVAQSQRGNGIHLDRATGAELRNNSIATVRDGIYFSWSEYVLAEDNTMTDLRYGVHYMYSDHNRLVGNLAFDNDVGFALMVSKNLTIEHNVAVNNTGSSGHGILIKGIDDSHISGNHLVGNTQGLYVYNAHGNTISDNLILENSIGVQFTAGSSGETVIGNSFIANHQSVVAPTNAQINWNTTEYGNYWSDARVVDLNGDGISQLRHQPTGTVENLIRENPEATIFEASPAFDAVRLAESSFPILESPGVVDHRPLAEPPHDNWRQYYGNNDN